MNIVVTGASGFIGGNIAETLAVNPQHTILATGRSSTKKFINYPNINYFQQDLSQEMATLSCEVCIHCAGLADDTATKEQFEKHNVLATKHLLHALMDCKVFIFISSASVYNFQDGKPKCEEDASLDKTSSLYGRSKLQAEHLVQNSGIPSIYILRPRAVYGTGDRVLLPRILKLIKGSKMIIPSRLGTQSSLTHIQNLCEAITKAIAQSKLGVHVFNIADQKTYNLKSVFGEILAKKVGKKKFILVPICLIQLVIFVNKMLGRKATFSDQSLKYITQNAVIDIRKAEHQFNYSGQYEFYSSIDHLNL
jgi:nucleoside-diphosphate-sugar epimerase